MSPPTFITPPPSDEMEWEPTPKVFEETDKKTNKGNDEHQKRKNPDDGEEENRKYKKRDTKRKEKKKAGKISGKNVEKLVVEDKETINLITTTRKKRDFLAAVDAEIKRCEENIAKGMPKIAFTEKIGRLKKEKQNYIDVLNQNPGMEWETLERIKALENLVEHLERKGDPCKELKNVIALIAAYKNQSLKYDGLATYWCDGKRLEEEPAKFDMDDVIRLNTEENRAGGGFWVEGLDFPGPNPKKMRYHITRGAGSPKLLDFLFFNVKLRLDHRLHRQGDLPLPPEVELLFMDDTGTASLGVFQDDMPEIMGNEYTLRKWPLDHVMGYTYYDMANNDAVWEVMVAVEANLGALDKNNKDVLLSDNWFSLPMGVQEEDRITDGKENDRLSGLWTRNVFYTASAPARKWKLYFSDLKSGITSKLPAVPPAQQKTARFRRPLRAAKWNAAQTAIEMDSDSDARGTIPRDILNPPESPKPPKAPKAPSPPSESAPLELIPVDPLPEAQNEGEDSPGEESGDSSSSYPQRLLPSESSSSSGDSNHPPGSPAPQEGPENQDPGTSGQ